ncbi:OmpA family protein [Streptomyces sp. NPDC127084]|uniref:OmpA family protein n=1 Tax=Streptomyces sp. NPDC127084 TaxID=3347133 RepID=UPI003657D743
MVNGARPNARGQVRRIAVAVALLAAAGAIDVPNALADEGPSVPPGTEASAAAPVEVNPEDTDLKMADGATLGESRVLDIVQVVEEQGGEERREDTNATVKFALQAEVLFAKDSSALGPAANARIVAIAAEIRKQNAAKVRVFGFTDNLGTSAHGDVLSKQRANAVHGVLSRELGGGGTTFEIRGYGEQYPIADNGTEEGRKKNRRVEVSFPRGEGGS